ncbi:MAG: nucleotidyltransferase domain-containing protein [bacterium]
MDQDLKTLIQRAAQALKAAGAREVYVFGSAAAGGRRRPDSDIDLAVSGLAPELFFEAMARAHDALDQPLDLVDLDEDNPFTRYLKEKGRMLRVA